MYNITPEWTISQDHSGIRPKTTQVHSYFSGIIARGSHLIYRYSQIRGLAAMGQVLTMFCCSDPMMRVRVGVIFVFEDLQQRAYDNIA